MTSYSNDSCLYPTYNNENDAYTCNSGPINSSLHNGKYGNNGFQNNKNEGSYDYCDYGNTTTSYNSDFQKSFDTSFQKQLPTTSLDNDTTTMMMATSSSYAADPGGGNFDGYVGRLSALDNGFCSKRLPQPPSIKQSSSMFDGMYTSSGTAGGCGGSLQWQDDGFTANEQSATPPARTRILPHPTSGGVAGVHEFARNKPQYEDQRNNAVVYLQEGHGGVNVPQSRILPQPRASLSKTFAARNHILKRQHFQDTTTTINNHHDETPNYVYDDTTRTIMTNNDQYACPKNNTNENCDIYAWAKTSINSTTIDINNLDRPHTSIAPYHMYTDGDGDYYSYDRTCYNDDDDNLSTYSDTPIALSTQSSSSSLSAALIQHKLQQQRKISLLMAMTTASVIASGETRIAAKKQRHQTNNQVIISPTIIKKDTESSTKTTKSMNDYSLKYGGSLFLPPPTTTTTTTTTSSISSPTVIINSTATTNTTNRTSEILIGTITTTTNHATIGTTEPATILYNSSTKTETLPSTTTATTTTAVMRPTRSRKLPKCLPMIPKARIKTENGNTTDTGVIRNKILPKVPSFNATQSNNNLFENDCFVMAQEVAIATTTTTTTSTSISSSTSNRNDQAPVDISFSNQNTNISKLNLTSSDLSNNNRNANNHSLDVSTSKSYDNVDDQTSTTSSTTSCNTINYVFSIPSSTSQTTTATTATSFSSTKMLSPPLMSSSSNTDYLHYLQSYSLPTFCQDKLTDIESNTAKATTAAAATTTTTTMTSTTFDVLSSRRKSIAEPNIDFSTQLHDAVESTKSSTAIPGIISDYSAYIDSLATTVAFTSNSYSTASTSSPPPSTSTSTSLNVFSKVSSDDSFVPLEAKTFFSCANTSTSNSYMDLLVTSSENIPTIDSIVPKDISLQTSFLANDVCHVNDDNITQQPYGDDSINQKNNNNDFFIESYDDYIKKFQLPELPPLLTATDDAADHLISKEIKNDKSQLDIISKSVEIQTKKDDDDLHDDLQLPYVMDYLKNDYNNTKNYDVDDNDYFHSFKDNEKFPNDIDRSANISINEETSPILIANSTTALTTPTATFDRNKDIDFYTFDKEYGSEYHPLNDNLNENFHHDSSDISTAFDDSFYDSFKVDLDTLTAVVITSFDEKSSMTTSATTITTTATSALTENIILQDISSSKSDISDRYESTVTTTQGGYYRPANTKPLASSDDVTKPHTTSISNSTASKATSLIGELSKNIKGSLFDGVLTGASAPTTSLQQSQTTTAAAAPTATTTTKKGFGFNLASKLVPNVGGLLGAASSGNKNATTKPATVQPSSSYNTDVAAVMTTTGNGTTVNSSVGRAPRIQGLSENYLEESSFGSCQIADDYCDVDYNNQQQQQSVVYSFGMENTDNTGTGDTISDYDEYGVGIYDEYENYNMTSAYNVGSGIRIIETTTTTVTDPLTNLTIANSIGDTKSSTSLSSSIAIVADQPQKTELTSSIKPGGSMFGSFLGKAAAAVQSATQAVNQGAKAAIVQHQKFPSTIITTTKDPIVTIASNNAYNSQMMQQQHLQDELSPSPSSLLGLQTYSSIVTAAGTDYENSNMVVVYNNNNEVTMNTNNYYSNGNQSQPPIVTTAKMLPTVPAVGKKLPNITNGNKSGIGYLIKQQPTEIYDDDDDQIAAEEYEEPKSPNYIGENGYYRDLEHTKDSIPKVNHLNGYYEQHHIFNDTAGTSGGSVGVGIGGGYDYREDYFDEEDEYKYLEREAEAEQERLYRQQRKQQKLLNQHQKQSSLEFIEESHEAEDDDDDDDIDIDIGQDEPFNDDNYPSEDSSGNYLDESSSGSVGGMAIKMHRERTNIGNTDSSMLLPVVTSATRSSVTMSSIGGGGGGLHQQIQKQDSIIVEEEEKMLPSLVETITESPESMIEKSNAAFRRKSSDIMIDDDDNVDDQLGELPQSSQRKKKVLIRSETEEVVSGHMHIMKRQKVTAKQRWHWAYNKIILQLNDF